MAQIYPNQLDALLKKSLAPVYLVHGDELLTQMECADAIRAEARCQGYTERQVFSVDRSFDWNSLAAESASLSLFAEQRILELRLPTGKAGTEGSKVLYEFIQQAIPDTLLLVIAGKLDAATKRTKWYKAFEQTGVTVAVYPIDAERLPAWITQRFQQRKMSVDAAAVALLTERTEGNLLACTQEIEKLYLLYGEGAAINADQVEDSVTSSARYTVYTLVDAAMLGDMSRCQQILRGLEAEGVPATLVLWALSREIHTLQSMAADLPGSHLNTILTSWRVWDKRKPLVSAALQRLSGRHFPHLLRQCAQAERSIKGFPAGTGWNELLQLLAMMTAVGRLPMTPDLS
ncbi:MAG: DNA polymerase III subunit delta [Gammaproteobacteria bacterium]